VSTSISKLTGIGNYFEDFEVGAKLRHARGTTIGEIENQMLTKLVLKPPTATTTSIACARRNSASVWSSGW